MRRVKLRCLRDAILLNEIGLGNHDVTRKLGELSFYFNKTIDELSPPLPTPPQKEPTAC